MGNYTASFLAEAIHLVFFVGLVPIGTRFKKEFQSIPVPAIAYVAGVVRYVFVCLIDISIFLRVQIETFLGYYQASGFFDKPKRQSVSKFMENVDKHRMNLINIGKKNEAILEDIQEELAANAMCVLLYLPTDLPLTIQLQRI